MVGGSRSRRHLIPPITLSVPVLVPSGDADVGAYDVEAGAAAPG